MQADQKRIRRRRKFLKLRKYRTGLTVILLILLVAATYLLLSIYEPLFVASTVQSKMTDAYSTVQTLTRVYETIPESDAVHYLDSTGYSYLLTDADGAVLAQGGKNTCGEPFTRYNWYYRDFNLSADHPLQDQITCYLDTESNYLSRTGQGISVNASQINSDAMDNFMTKLMASGEADEPVVEDTEGSFAELVNSIHVPMWISSDVRGGTQKLILRVSANVEYSDIELLSVSMAALAIIFLIVFIVLLINLVHSLINQHRVRKLFFTDLATHGHNWIWFLVNGELFLRSRWNAKKQFAVAELVIVKYRSFCVCHSLEDGERVLKQIHTYLKSTLGRKEICAHASEDSFSLLLNVTDQAALKARMEEIIRGLSQLDAQHSFAFQTGIEIIPPAAPAERRRIDLEKLYNNACTARLTLEPSDDSGIAFFGESLVEAQKWESRVQELQQSALENEEFVVYYQPKYDPRTRLLRGAEALIRWQSPELGFVSPGRFIPIFEKNGFITEIDHYMLRHVARDQKKWLDLGLKCVPVSVNVSRAHFIESDLAEQICQLVDSEGAPHDLIEIELTESAFFDDKKAMIATITKLKNAGFAVSMDDFGSGYSSLNSLKDMPLDVLKLDADFFRGETPDSDRGEIVIAEAIKLAKCLRMRTVAEGVEQREQVEFLASQGCDMIQGFYFAKPMPGTDYEERLRLGRSDNDETVSPAQA